MTDAMVAKAQEYLPNIPLTPVSQGAEAIVFETEIHPYSTNPDLRQTNHFIIKYRPAKPYRHPKIDAAITKNRTMGEVKFMNKLTKLNINCPNLISADISHGIIWMEYLGEKLPNGNITSLKNWFWYLEREKGDEECVSKQVEETCIKVGELIGKLHMNDMIHGDLTSSNILLQQDQPQLIDFGLSSYSGLPEDKAVDLYVFERAIISTHSLYSDKYNQWLLTGYEQVHRGKEFSKVNGARKLHDTLSRLKEVRLRGRKRSMLG